MADNKKYSLREKIIDERLSMGWHSRQQLEDACNNELSNVDMKTISSKQTILNDIKNVNRKSKGKVETKRFGKQTFYRYKNSNYSIYKQELNSSDFLHLKETIRLLSNFKGMPQFEWIYDISMRLKLRSYNDDVRPKVFFQDNSINTGIEYFSILFDAIILKKTIIIDYHSFKRDSSKEFVLSPYCLKQYNNRWFLLGKSPGYERISVYPLDRIKYIANAGISYEETTIDFEEYFENVIGVTISDAPVETIRVWISAQQIGYLETKPLHRSQRLISKDENGGIFEFDLIPNYELEQALLAYGEHAKVLSPESFRDKMKERIKKSFENKF